MALLQISHGSIPQDLTVSVIITLILQITSCDTFADLRIIVRQKLYITPNAICIEISLFLQSDRMGYNVYFFDMIAKFITSQYLMALLPAEYLSYNQPLS